MKKILLDKFIKFGGDNNNGYLCIGALQICWGKITIPENKGGEQWILPKPYDNDTYHTFVQTHWYDEPYSFIVTGVQTSTYVNIHCKGETLGTSHKRGGAILTVGYNIYQ